MKKIAIITSTRAEYGLLYPLITELRKKEDDAFKVEVIVTGTHLDENYGMTVKEIEKDGVRIDERIPITMKSSSALDISSNQADALIKFTKLFAEKMYDAIVILGDRYEMLAIAVAAGNTRTPIFHLCGGDTTEGAIDEWIRHSITKMSYLHFTTNEQSRKRVIQLGENPDRVFNYGSTSIDNILRSADMSKEEALESVGLRTCDYALCTYHPVTTEDNIEGKITAFLEAISHFPSIEFIITKSNADLGGSRINELLDEANSKIENVHVFTSLGTRRYLSLMKNALFVIGNSSSGIIETPSFKIPTVNIGNRQRGRLQCESIINCEDNENAIIVAIQKALSVDMQNLCKKVKSPYGDGNAAPQIAECIYSALLNDCITVEKEFYNL